MKINMTIELELNRAWVYNKDGEVIGETNFIVSGEFAKKAFQKLNSEHKLVCEYSDFEEFIETYEPETDGEALYQMALAENQLIS